MVAGVGFGEVGFDGALLPCGEGAVESAVDGAVDGFAVGFADDVDGDDCAAGDACVEGDGPVLADGCGVDAARGVAVASVRGASPPGQLLVPAGLVAQMFMGP